VLAASSATPTIDLVQGPVAAGYTRAALVCEARSPGSGLRTAHRAARGERALGAPGGGTATSIATLGPTTPADVWLTAADAHSSGESVLLRSYTRVWELRLPGALLLEEVFAQPPTLAVAAAQPQAEAIAFVADGLGYLLGSEQLAPIQQVGCAP